MRRTFLVAGLFLVVAACSSDGDGEPGIDVIDVSGPLDASALDFMRISIEEAAVNDQVMAVLQINSPGRTGRRGSKRRWTRSWIARPCRLAVWVGPAPALANGGAGASSSTSSTRQSHPGHEIGSSIARSSAWRSDHDLVNPMTAEESGLELQPTIRQYLQDLDGVTFQTADGPVTVETLKPFEDGVTLRAVTFRQPGLATRFWRLAATPEAAFFFLVVGLTIASFEFFAIGPGVAAGVAAISLLLAGWGIVTLPIKWWALALALLGWALLTAAYQKGGVLVLTIVGAVMLQVAGTFFVDGSGQIDPRWYLVLPSVSGSSLFLPAARCPPCNERDSRPGRLDATV